MLAGVEIPSLHCAGLRSARNDRGGGDGTVAGEEIASSHITAVLGARDGRALGNDR